MSSGFGEPAKPKTLNELIPLSSSFTKKHQPCFNGKHIGAYGLINMNGRVYDPRLGRFMSPDPYVQAPDFSQSFNRYSYVWNNPLKYTDPDGEFIVTAIIVGAIVGAYIGGSAAEGWQMNPTKWKWDKNTWGGIGMGAIFGGAAGVGFFYAAPALAGTAFFSHFGASGTIAAYTLTGGVAGGLAGYGAGFSGGMIYSKGNWKYSHKSGIAGAQVGAALGSTIGAVAGIIQGYEVPKPPPLPRMPQREIALNTNHGAFYGTPIPELSAALFLDADFKGYYHGARVYEHRIFSGGAGICLPPFGIGVGPGVFSSGRYYDRTLLAHEYGHWLQYYRYGPYFYYGVIAPASLYFATKGDRYGWTELDANRRAFEFFGNPIWWQHFYFPLNKP